MKLSQKLLALGGVTLADYACCPYDDYGMPHAACTTALPEKTPFAMDDDWRNGACKAWEANTDATYDGNDNDCADPGANENWGSCGFQRHFPWNEISTKTMRNRGCVVEITDKTMQAQKKSGDCQCKGMGDAINTGGKVSCIGFDTTKVASTTSTQNAPVINANCRAYNTASGLGFTTDTHFDNAADGKSADGSTVTGDEPFCCNEDALIGDTLNCFTNICQTQHEALMNGETNCITGSADTKSQDILGRRNLQNQQLKFNSSGREYVANTATALGSGTHTFSYESDSTKKTGVSDGTLTDNGFLYNLAGVPFLGGVCKLFVPVPMNRIVSVQVAGVHVALGGEGQSAFPAKVGTAGLDVGTAYCFSVVNPAEGMNNGNVHNGNVAGLATSSGIDNNFNQFTYTNDQDFFQQMSPDTSLGRQAGVEPKIQFFDGTDPTSDRSHAGTQLQDSGSMLSGNTLNDSKVGANFDVVVHIHSSWCNSPSFWNIADMQLTGDYNNGVLDYPLNHLNHPGQSADATMPNVPRLSTNNKNCKVIDDPNNGSNVVCSCNKGFEQEDITALVVAAADASPATASPFCDGAACSAADKTAAQALLACEDAYLLTGRVDQAHVDKANAVTAATAATTAYDAAKTTWDAAVAVSCAHSLTQSCTGTEIADVITALYNKELACARAQPADAADCTAKTALLTTAIAAVNSGSNSGCAYPAGTIAAGCNAVAGVTGISEFDALLALRKTVATTEATRLDAIALLTNMANNPSFTHAHMDLMDKRHNMVAAYNNVYQALSNGYLQYPNHEDDTFMNKDGGYNAPTQGDYHTDDWSQNLRWPNAGAFAAFYSFVACANPPSWDDATVAGLANPAVSAITNPYAFIYGANAAATTMTTSAGNTYAEVGSVMLDGRTIVLSVSDSDYRDESCEVKTFRGNVRQVGYDVTNCGPGQLPDKDSKRCTWNWNYNAAEVARGTNQATWNENVNLFEDDAEEWFDRNDPHNFDTWSTRKRRSFGSANDRKAAFNKGYWNVQDGETARQDGSLGPNANANYFTNGAVFNANGNGEANGDVIAVPITNFNFGLKFRTAGQTAITHAVNANPVNCFTEASNDCVCKPSFAELTAYVQSTFSKLDMSGGGTGAFVPATATFTALPTQADALYHTACTGTATTAGADTKQLCQDTDFNTVTAGTSVPTVNSAGAFTTMAVCEGYKNDPTNTEGFNLVNPASLSFDDKRITAAFDHAGDQHWHVTVKCEQAKAMSAIQGYESQRDFFPDCFFGDEIWFTYSYNIKDLFDTTGTVGTHDRYVSAWQSAGKLLPGAASVVAGGEI
jgi:hypothetical protein